jgi:hypothetical protein
MRNRTGSLLGACLRRPISVPSCDEKHHNPFGMILPFIRLDLDHGHLPPENRGLLPMIMVSSLPWREGAVGILSI